MKTRESLLARRFALVAGMMLAVAQILCGQTWVEDDFDGPLGSPPDAAKFEWSGEVRHNGTGQLDFSTWSVNESWLKSKASAPPGDDGQPLVLTFRASAYAEGWNPGVYGNKQPRGLRVGSDAANAVEFYSAAWNIIGMRVRKDGAESSATHPFPAGVNAMHDYEIRVTGNEAVFIVNGNPIGTFSTNLPTQALNLFISTHDGYAGNVPITVDHVSLSSSSSATDPSIRVEQPEGTVMPSGAGRDFGIVIAGEEQAMSFRLANTGNWPLTVHAAEFQGDDAGAFALTSPLPAQVAQGASASFEIRFAPSAGGAKSTVFRISSDDPLFPDFDIVLGGHALSPFDDTDGDGMNDAAEYRLAVLGFDWTSPQPDLVAAYFAEALNNGLFTRDQIKAMRPSVPLIARNPASGNFLLSIGLMKSTDLLGFQAAPFLESGLRIPDDGVVEYEFASPDPAAFFRLELK